MTDITLWMQDFIERMQQGFGDRLQFLGLQGSCARGEATEGSDIDVVVLLDRIDFADLTHYKELVADLPERHRLCGFVGSMDTLQSWDRAELVAFCLDTTAYFGSLDIIQCTLTRNDVRRAVQNGACTIYHACAHNFVHTDNPEILRGLQKALFFVLRLKYYDEAGRFVSRRSELLPLLSSEEQALLNADGTEFNRLSCAFLEWATVVISRYGGEAI